VSASGQGPTLQTPSTSTQRKVAVGRPCGSQTRRRSVAPCGAPGPPAPPPARQGRAAARSRARESPLTAPAPPPSLRAGPAERCNLALRRPVRRTYLHAIIPLYRARRVEPRPTACHCHASHGWRVVGSSAELGEWVFVGQVKRPEVVARPSFGEVFFSRMAEVRAT